MGPTEKGLKMQRKIEQTILQWLASKAPEPLLIKGVRRVGKTYIATEFLRSQIGGGNHVYLDFQTDLAQLSLLFEGRTSADRLVADIESYTGKTIVPEKSVIVFDEVQLCEKALNSLRFFAQSPFRVLATGSLLGVTLQKGDANATAERALPFPSDVRHVTMHPMDFEEFLWALGQEPLAQGIRRCYEDATPFFLHEEALALYRTYLVVGGMPKAVGRYASTKELQPVREVQSEINETYISDMPSAQAALCKSIWNSIPSQLARESTRKFKYGDVVKGGRAKQFAEPLGWMEAAGIIKLNPQTNSTSAPLVARKGGAFFKAYMGDTGLMFYKFGLSPDALLNPATYGSLSDSFRGALAENYVMQALTANGLSSFYWTPGDSSGEVEFVMNTPDGSVLPIEVKSGQNVRSISLRTYMKKSGCPLGIRISTRQFDLEGELKSIPLYAAFCIGERTSG